MKESASHEEARRAREELFARIALKNGLVTPEQLEEARAIQSRIEELGVSAKPLDEILLEKGFVVPEGHEKILAHVAKISSATQIPGYKILAKLGQGSMGTVYRATQLSVDRPVAIKVLAPFLQRNERFVARFLTEAKVLAKLNHPNIVQCIDVGESAGRYYLVMEYCDGPTVGEILKRGGRMAEERAINIVLQVARALDHAFSSAIIHRDIKPDNVMIIAGGTAKLCDLGLVRDLATSGNKTDTGIVMGTPNYISPEQARGDDHLDTRTDIYSLGCTFYHMVTGSTPFRNANPAVTMVAHINDVPQTARERCPEVSAETSRIIEKMMRKSAVDRYQTPATLVHDLEKLLARVQGDEKGPVLRSRFRRR